MHHNQHTIFGGFHHGPKKGGIINLKQALVGHKQLQAGDTLINHTGNFSHHLWPQISDGYVETVINGRFMIGFAMPLVNTLLERAADRLNYKINVGGGAAKSSASMAGKKVI